MVTQQHSSTTVEALSILHNAEQKILSSLSAASLAIRSLSAPTTHTTFPNHSATFLKDLESAQELLRSRIQCIAADLPFENVTMRRLIEADLAVQRTAHVHRSLVRTLASLEEAPVQGGSISAAGSPGWMPSPVANPLAGLGVGASPAGAAITIPVPSPDTGGMGVGISAAVALNGGLQEEEGEGDRMEL